MPADRLLLFGAALAYLVVPGHPGALVPGLPMGPIGLSAAIALAGWAIALPGAPPRARLVAAALLGLGVVKVGLSTLAPPYGLVAEYRAGGPTAPVERSTDWPRLGLGEGAGTATRVDRALAFRGDEFPVHFFNDARRFNFFRADEPRRDLLPFSARWTGWFWAANPGRHRFALEANGRASLSLPGLATAEGGPLTTESGQRVGRVVAEAHLPAGLHPLEVRYSRPDEAMPWLVVRAAEGEAELEPLAGPRVVRDGADLGSLARDGFIRAVAVALDATVLVLALLLLVAHAGRVLRSPGPDAPRAVHRSLERGLLGVFAVLALGAELAGHAHLLQRTTILSGGNDWLAYEGFARGVLLDGPLLPEGRPLGQGQPYYYQPLYVYWLAITHVVLGEGLFGPLFANAALGVAASLLAYVLTRELFGRLAAAAAILLFTVYRVTVFAPTTGLLLSENLLIPLVPLLLLLLARAVRTGSWSALAGAGAVLGLAALTRTTPLVLLPLGLPVLALAFRRLGLSRSSGALRLGAFVLICLLVISPATVRNYLVSGRPALITSSAGANLWEAHRPTARVDLSGIGRHPVYDFLGLDRPTREVVEFARQDPAGYVGTLIPMGLYAVGVVGAPSGTSDVHPGLLGLWLAYLLAAACVPAARRPATWFLHLFVWSHLAQMAVFFSHQYGLRLILPMYVAMMPIIGGGIAGLWGLGARAWGLVAWRRRRAGRAPVSQSATANPLPLLVLAVALGSLSLVGWTPSPERAREAFYGLSGDVAIAARQAGRPEHMLVADAVYFVGEDSRSSAVAYLHGLAYPSLRWFDGARGLVLPPAGEQALYVLPDRAAPDLARRCLGPNALLAREQDPPTRAWLDLALASVGAGECGASQHSVGATFEGGARLLGFDAPGSAEPGQPLDVAIRWEVLARPTNRARPFVRLVDGGGHRWGQAETTAYPSASWRPGEVALGIARVEIDPTLPPAQMGLEFGFTAGSGLAPLAEDGPWGARGEQTARAGSLRLVSRSTPLDPQSLPITLPSESVFGGIRLLGAHLDRPTAGQGDRLRLSLFWENRGGRLPELDVSVALRDRSGAVIEEWRGGPVDGTYPTTAWKPGEIVRDMRDIVLPARAPTEELELAVGVGPAGRSPERYEPLTTLTVRAIPRRFAEPNPQIRQEARFGDLARLVGYEVKDRRVKVGDSVVVTLHWQAMAETPDNFTVSLQLLGPDGQIVSRQEEEPAGGRRPTTGWLPGEYVEDEHRLRIGPTPRGRYHLGVVVYRIEDRRRLLDPAGNDRVVLGTEVVVE